jgi:hypothetical protein
MADSSGDLADKLTIILRRQAPNTKYIFLMISFGSATVRHVSWTSGCGTFAFLTRIR